MSEQGPSKRGRVVRRRWHVVALVTMALIAFVMVSCTPSQAPLDPNSLPKDIDLMTDTQVEQSLAYLAPSIIADFDNPKIRALIPSDKLPAVQQTIDSLKTPEGIASLVPFFRAQAKVVPHGLPPRNEAVNFPMLGLSAGDFDRIPVTPSATGTRTPPPSGAGTHDTGGNLVGANVPIAPSSAACGAPGGVGAIAAPAGIVAGQLLTPGHDVFTKTSTGFFIGTDGLLSPTGVDPVAGQGPGIELRPG